MVAGVLKTAANGFHPNFRRSEMTSGRDYVREKMPILGFGTYQVSWSIFFWVREDIFITSKVSQANQGTDLARKSIKK
ncbi:hypothetical protein ANCDUO_16972 [Ancylostoma duodenale]|uniref:Uncharacterized protein n=1 Tax=Ancylostoma duodenale TaxID=51022 RepID=A0A0C2CT02_9BILA|nr:hypothetical protein ANCDUO_16972 [Ancylostoma duodenale]